MVVLMNKRLGKKQWIDFGLKTLATQGINAVRVEPMAAELQVTKGSFYWHFKNRNALLEEILSAWKGYATNDIITNVEEQGGDATQRIRCLFTTVLEGDNRLDKEIRIWADSDNNVQTALRQIDQRRVTYLEDLFKELGFTAIQATARARLVYHALIGQFTMDVPAIDPFKPSRQFEIIFNMLIQKPN